MAQLKPMDLNIIYRSNHSQLALLTVMQVAGIWDQVGIGIKGLRLFRGATKAEDELIAGKADLIFGCHITPHIRVAQKVPIVCLAQTVNIADDLVVSRDPITDLKQLEGKVVAGQKFLDEEGHLSSHPRGTHELYLKRAGVDSGKIDFQEPPEHENAYETVLGGRADAAFVSSGSEISCRRAGLKMLPMGQFSMVNSITFTTLLPTVQENPEMVRRVIRGLALGVHFFKTEKEETLKILSEHVATRMHLDDDELLNRFYERSSNCLEPKLYPQWESILNAFRISEMVRPGLSSEVNPLELWDLHFVRELNQSGFINELYQGTAVRV
jgi:ABC-type nitrate/sulfonate/bicarbonate transport system substrate-binding protein